jgi:formylglycine-generating enzyme required for sulfatase activity
MTEPLLSTSTNPFGAILERLIDMASGKTPPSFRELVRAAGLDPERDFVGASLRDLDFRGEDLRGFDFSQSDLTGADFRRADIAGMSLAGADLTGVIGLVGARFRDFDAAPEMIIVPAGEFMMGAAASEGDEAERPQHVVRIGSPFAAGICPVTRGEFAAFVEATGHKIVGGKKSSWRDPGFPQYDDHPVVGVNWHDAQAYVAWLTETSGGRPYRLPSEAEWEYCCRAGRTSAYSTGDSITPEQANFGREPKGTTPVRTFPPNAWGLRDMHGNVWEWCDGNWHKDYSGSPPSDGSAWQGGDSSLRVLRGGSWDSSPVILRSANRDWGRPDLRNNILGFRVVRTL